MQHPMDPRRQVRVRAPRPRDSTVDIAPAHAQGSSVDSSGRGIDRTMNFCITRPPCRQSHDFLHEAVGSCRLIQASSSALLCANTAPTIFPSSRHFCQRRRAGHIQYSWLKPTSNKKKTQLQARRASTQDAMLYNRFCSAIFAGGALLK